ncbi:hypothetical protein BKI52_45075 [marine bacterium AO1-C]|nr:hypothetical protein BKI52_45075 [marine bacterium AO1-C]
MQTKLERQADQLWEGYREENPKFWKRYQKVLNQSRTIANKSQKPVLSKTPVERTQAFQQAYSQLGDKEMVVWVNTKELRNDLLNLKLILGFFMFLSVCSGELEVILSMGLIVGIFFIVAYAILFFMNTIAGSRQYELRIKFEVDGLRFGEKTLDKKMFYKDMIHISKKPKHHFVLKFKNPPSYLPSKYRFALADKQGRVLKEANEIYTLLATVISLNKRH